MGNTDNSVQVAARQSEDTLLQLSFTPYAMAIDNVRGRLYTANSDGNSIYVYSTAGALLHLIQ
jgi:DNA-binding beta-propeller fold protein YncE